MALTIGRNSVRVRRMSIGFMRAGLVLVLIGLPIYQSNAVSSPSPTAIENRIEQAKQMKKTTVAKKKTAPAVAEASVTMAARISCKTTAPRHTGIAGASSSQIRKLAQYEAVCGSGVFSKLSFFIATPTTTAEAAEYADYVSGKLKEYARYGLAPLVFFEPTTSTGLVDMKKYASGTYDVALDAFFAGLKARGITNTTMGTWVPIPEGNIPVWTSVSPTTFAAVVTKAVSAQKKYFPTSKASLLLDTMSYPRANDWSGGRAVSLVPYVKGIPKGLINSFGLQGFPWVSPANQGSVTNGSVRDYLRVDLAAQAAAYLKVKQIWLNTGTYGMKYVGIAGQQVSVSPAKRNILLQDTVAQAQSLRRQGYKVAIHLFAEDKSKVAEATNWSYWANGKFATRAATGTFTAFAHTAQIGGISLWLFDAAGE